MSESPPTLGVHVGDDVALAEATGSEAEPVEMVEIEMEDGSIGYIAKRPARAISIVG